ncbi:MAG: Rid family hydrolase [Planctomycetota bacterium]
MTSDENPGETLEMRPRTPGERFEMEKLGLLDAAGEPLSLPLSGGPVRGERYVKRWAISNREVLNEAHEYQPTPSAFARGMRTDVRAGSSILWISGTASVDAEGRSVYPGDFRAQCWRTLRNITELLRSEGANWHDIVRTTCYLRDIERDYRDFNEVRTHFLKAQNLEPLPASTGIQARICRQDLLVEIEAIAMLEGPAEA